MTKMTVRDFEEKDSQKYVDWLHALASINLVDSGVYEYPRIAHLAVDKEDETVLINSVHPVLVQEALAPKPGLSPKDEARALRALNDALKELAFKCGYKEIWFGCKDERVIRFAQKHGFEVLNFPVLRMKV
jgi:hypothetical protein